MKWVCVVFLSLFVSAGVHADSDSMLLRTFGEDGSTLIYVFTSASCPHCAHYHDEVLPELKQKYIDSGLAQLKIVDMPYDARALDAMQLARCISNDAHYTRYMTSVYENQAIWGYGKVYLKLLKDYAEAAGLSSSKADLCLKNQALRSRIIEQRDNLAGLYQVHALPTTVIVKGFESQSVIGSDKPEIFRQIEEVLGLK